MAGEFTRETNLFGVDFGDCGVLFRDANRRVDDVDDVGVYGDLRFVRRVNAERAFEENRRVESRERGGYSGVGVRSARWERCW